MPAEGTTYPLIDNGDERIIHTLIDNGDERIIYNACVVLQGCKQCLPTEGDEKIEEIIPDVIREGRVYCGKCGYRILGKSSVIDEKEEKEGKEGQNEGIEGACDR